MNSSLFLGELSPDDELARHAKAFAIRAKALDQEFDHRVFISPFFFFVKGESPSSLKNGVSGVLARPPAPRQGKKTNALALVFIIRSNARPLGRGRAAKTVALGRL